MRSIILRPLINEKSMSLTKMDYYTFEVLKGVTKKQIEKQVKDRFNVDVLSVKTINRLGKRKMQRSRKGYFTTSPLKKAIVQLKKGQKIALFEKVSKEEEVEVKTGEEKVETKEKRSLLKGTKVRIEKDVKDQKSKAKKEDKK